MPKSIPIPPLTPVIDGVLVKRRHLERGAVRVRVDRDIRQWAKRHVRESQARTAQLQRDAGRNGYAHGIAAALEDTVAQLMRTEQLCCRWRSEITTQMQTLLAQAVRHPQALLAALEDAFDAFAANASDVARIVTLPVSMRAQSESIRERLAAACPAPMTLEWHSGDTMAVRCGDHVIEYDPAEYIERATQSLEIQPEVMPDDLHTLLSAALSPLQARVKALAGHACAQMPEASLISPVESLSPGAPS